jgi:glycosyltransferase involved in cell wall biosynthesis
MRVLLLGDFNKFGGTRTYFYSLINYFKVYDLTIAVNSNVIDEELLSYLNTINCKMLTYKSPNFFLKTINRLNYYILLPIQHYIKIRPDIIIVSSAGYWIYFIYMLFPSKFIYILHSSPRNKLSYLWNLIIRLFLSKEKIIINVSKQSKNEMIKYWNLCTKQHKFIYLLHNCTKEKIQILNNFEKKIILTLGHLVNYKNPKFWLELSKNLLDCVDSELQFIWAGDGPLLEELNSLVGDNYSKNIHFIGYQNNVDELYKNCSIYFQPSILESFGLSVLDALSYGIPQIVSSEGGLPEVVSDNETGYVIPYFDIKLYSEKFKTLLIDKNVYSSFSQNSVNRYKKYFSEEIWKANLNYIIEGM